jgi:hypothetical protein
MVTQEGVRSEGISDRIHEASRAIQGMLGTFIPIQETRKIIAEYAMDAEKPLKLPALLDAQTVKLNGAVLTDYRLQPANRHWTHGPFSMLQRDCGFERGDEIEITGLWGLYSETVDLDLSINQPTDTEKTLVTTNGGLISLGMILQLENEQELVVSGKGSKNSPAPIKAVSLLDGDLSDIPSEQLLKVDNGAEFFEGEVLRINSEDLHIERISGNELTVIRGWNDSLVKTHADNSEIYIYRTFGVVRGVNGTTAAAHINVYPKRYKVPDDLNWLCRQITGLMIMKAKSGFQGRTGNADSGESMYFSEFPTNQIKLIKENYSL